jgi:GNAT superfamily N-acetyltransferase
VSAAFAVRAATAADAPALHRLMRGLSVFERYDRLFAVTPEYVREMGFERRPPAFHALVAERPPAGPEGMLVWLLLPFAFRARPTFYIKELYVAEGARGAGAGEALMRRAAALALERGCAIARWQVARWNEGAARFYERLGARPDPEWVDYALDEGALRTLAGR